MRIATRSPDGARGAGHGVSCRRSRLAESPWLVAAPKLLKSPSMRHLVAIVLSSIAAGCAYARPVAVGPPAPPRPPGCDITYERVDPQEAARRWQQVGVVCVSYTQDHNPTGDDAFAYGHDEIVAAACGLGGYVVAPIGACTNGRQNAVELGVYRPRGLPSSQ